MKTARFRHRPQPLAICLFWLLAFGQNLAAQDLHVYYNLLNDSMLYQRDGKVLTRPKIRRGDRVVVHFTEFNPYLYQANVRVEQSKNSAATAALPSFLGSFQAMMPGMGGLFSGLAASDTSRKSNAVFPFLDAPLLQLGETSVTLRGLFSNARGADQVLKQAQAELAEMAEIRAEAEQLAAQFEALRQAETALNVAATTLPDLLQNPALKPSSIQKIGEQLFQTAFRPQQTGTEINLADVFRAQNLPAEKARVLGKLAETQTALEAQSAHLEPLAAELGNLDLGSAEVSKFARDLRDLREKARQTRRQTDVFVAAEKQSASPARPPEAVMALYLKFQELRACTFAHEVAFTAEKDVVDIRAEFASRDSVGRAVPAKTKEIRLETSGGLDVSTGFGLAFGGFSTPEQRFSVRNDVIVADDAGDFQPFIASFLHFAPRSPRSWSLAATLGIGLSLQGGSAGRSPSFFVGPSLLVGRGQRMVVSGGLLLGEVARLARGYKVGDAFSDAGGDIPTQRRYESGFYVGASFRL